MWKMEFQDSPLTLEQSILSWGEEGRSIFDGLIRQALYSHKGMTNKDIHSMKEDVFSPPQVFILKTGYAK